MLDRAPDAGQLSAYLLAKVVPRHEQERDVVIEQVVKKKACMLMAWSTASCELRMDSETVTHSRTSMPDMRYE